MWHWNCSRCIGEGDENCRVALLAGDESTLTGVEGKEGLISVERKMNCCCYGCYSFKVR